MDAGRGRAPAREIIKAFHCGAALLIPRRADRRAHAAEADDLFCQPLNQMKRDGHAPIFISHKLREVVAPATASKRAARRWLVDNCAQPGVTRVCWRMMVGRRGDILERAHKPLGIRRGASCPARCEALQRHGTAELREVTLEIRSARSWRGGRFWATGSGFGGGGGGAPADGWQGRFDGGDAGIAVAPGSAPTLAGLTSPKAHARRHCVELVAETCVAGFHDQFAGCAEVRFSTLRPLPSGCDLKVRDFSIRIAFHRHLDAACRAATSVKLILARTHANNLKVLVAAQLDAA
ncbi:MAG: hypothetical protein H6639_10160 [Caldilineaceae bacterium]|nr:hypothetical protein [Caldilineaceae bacterium]